MDFLNQTNIQWGSCGNLSYSQPAFKGRNVTIFFKPFKFSATQTPIFYSNVPTQWIPVPSTVMYNATLGVFTTVFDTNIPNSGYLYAKYDLSGECGYIYLRTPNPVLGNNVEIGYYPASAVIRLTGEYSREWYNESSRSSMTLTEGLLTEEELHNEELVLTIYNSTRWTTGHYSVKCTKSTTNSLHTERVFVKVTVKPGVPVLNVPILREGSPANITFISRGGRPATNLSLWLDDANASVDHVKTYDNSTRTYTTIITLNDPARKDWKSGSCASSSSLFGKTATQRKTINCKYPPMMLTMDAPTITSYSQDSYTLKFSCFTDTYNDHCLLSWTKDGQLHYANTYETEKIQDSALMEFAIVSKENNDKPSAHLSVKDEVLLNADDSTSVTCTATSFPLSDIVWTVNGDTQLLVCNKSEKCVMKTIPIETKEHRNYTCTAYFEFGNYNTSAISSFLAIRRASKQKPYEIPNESEDASLTNSNGIPIVWIFIGLGVIFAAVILSTVIVLVRKRLLKKNQHINSSETQPVQHGADVQENETVEMNEEVTYAQVNKIRTKRTEAVGLQTKGSDTNLVYADIDIEHLETASKPPSRQRPPSPTEYADVDFIRTERGSNSDNIIT
ncbi:hypothetical protein MAR_028774 [Mya arenaria]|uniref:Ig-like domain-containing protein n=1 Tax=Mya arenaria TaxID=6604 RepID=A0ABY7DFM5_MYAAR|nr:hypothetical protein MAR_028774 [Mya arenaria]